jgi:hypothetical protein
MLARVGALLLGAAAWSYAQSCCGGTGTFLGGMERSGLGAGTLTAAAVYAYTAMERTLNGTQRIPDPNGSIAYAHVLNLEVEYSPLERWSLLVVVPFTDKARSINVPNGAVTLSQRYHAVGLGDAFALVKYQLVPPTLTSPWSVAIGGGIKVPTGPYQIQQNGVELPIDVQPGTSTWDALGWLLGTYQLQEPAATASLSVLVRKPGTNTNGRTIGTDVQAILALSTVEFDLPFVPILLGRLRWTDSDRQGNRTITATGTFRIELMPAIAFVSWDPVILRIGAQLPLYERTNGTQLVPSWGVFAELRTTMSLK